MKYKFESEKIEEFIEVTSELENLLTQRISDLHEVKGGMQARHAYILYRKLLWEAKYLITENMEK